ncbi:MAG: AGE family epimerase/isomerase [Candidatus Omnitrophica bacterium]|nr:AGE family epimerase/isomerase [Candidatus Omnitrophota bacterium]
MKRRAFIHSSIAAPAYLAVESRGESEAGAPSAGKRSALIKNGMIAEMPLEKVLERYRYDLFEDFLPFMDRHVIDHELGGFMCNTDRDGNNLTQDKSSWYEGRGIWVYSTLYNQFEPKDEYLEVAKKSVDFILKTEPKNSNECWPRQISREGEPLSTPCDDIYGDIFIAEGFAEYAEASGDRAYREKAIQILEKCVGMYDQADYLPDIGQTYLGREARPFPGARIMGHWMVFIRVCTQRLGGQADSKIEALADRCIDAILNHHFNPEFDLINELINHDLSRPENEYAQLVYTGHALETLWMVMDEAVRRRDKDLFQRAADSFKRHYLVAHDHVYGGVFRNLQNVNENIWSLDKVLWAQEEVLIGSLLIIEHLGEQWAHDIFSEMHQYVYDHYPLEKHGLPLWIFSADRKVTFEEKATRVEHFHHPRHLMMNIQALERIRDRNGRVSDVFA